MIIGRFIWQDGRGTGTCINECTKVQKPWRYHVHIMRMHAICRKMADHMYGFQWSSTGSLQQSGFRENEG